MYKLKFIDGCRFIQDSLSNLVDNLSEINNKDTMITSLTQSINKISKIDKKKHKLINKNQKISLQIT